MTYDLATVEAIAMLLCPACSEKRKRWQDRISGEFVHDDDPMGYEAVECEATSVLEAALKLDVQLYVGADLEFPTDEECGALRSQTPN